MKALTISEKLDFERGGEPIKQMGIGKQVGDKELIDNTDWAIDINKHGHIYDILLVIRDYKGFPILVLKNKTQGSWQFRCISLRGVFTEYAPSPESALTEMKSTIDRYIAELGSGATIGVKESIDFTREGSPLEKMGIGRSVKIMGKKDGVTYRAIILGKAEDMMRARPENSMPIGDRIYWVKITNGDKAGKNITVRKFDEREGDLWGLEWDLNLEESIDFTRDGNPFDTLQVGRKEVWNMSGETMAKIIIEHVHNICGPILDRIVQAVQDAGYKDLEAYQQHIFDYFDEHNEFPTAPKEIDDLERELEKTIKETIEKYPFLSNKKEAAAGQLFCLMLEGGPWLTNVEMMRQHLDPTYLKESLDFERKQNPLDSLDIGNKGLRMAKECYYTLPMKEKVLEAIEKELNYNKRSYTVNFRSNFLKWLKSWVERDFAFEDEEDFLIMNGFSQDFRRLISRYGIYESSVNFERGGDPIRSMDIGMFHFDVEFSGDIEDMEEDERRVAKKWNYNGVKITHIEGEADEDSSELFINLSDGDYIYFKQKSFMGPSRPERSDYAKISVKNSNVKDLEVHSDWLDELSNGSIIQATMRMYQDIKDGNIKMKVIESWKAKKVNENVYFQREGDPLDKLQIGDVQGRKMRHDKELLLSTLHDMADKFGTGLVTIVKNQKSKIADNAHVFQAEFKTEKKNIFGAFLAFESELQVPHYVYYYKEGDPESKTWCKTITEVIYQLEFKIIRMESITEAVDFTRDGTPLEKLDIGNEDFRMIDKMDRYAQEFSFEKSETPSSKDPDYMALQKWNGPKGQWIVLEKQRDERHTLKYWVSWKGIDYGKDSGLAKSFTEDKSNWEKYFGYPINLPLR